MATKSAPQDYLERRFTMRARLVLTNVVGVFTPLVLAAMGLFSVSPAMAWVTPSFQRLGFLDATPDDDSFSEALAVSADG